MKYLAFKAALLMFFVLTFASQAFAQITLPACSGSLVRYSTCEITLNTSSSYANDFLGTNVTATFSLSGSTLTKTVKGFYDGDNPTTGRGIFKIRFNASNLGTWSYTTSSPDIGLNGASGSFGVVSGSGSSAGFLRRNASNPKALVYDNGTKPFLWGQTYYQIVHNAQLGGGWRLSIDNSFDRYMYKVRMLLYPFGSYVPYLEGTEPFVKSTDHDVLDLSYWRKVDEVIDYLNRKQMIADVILFNDNLLAYASTSAKDQRYVRYALARLAAFRNVIWCLTNEWQLSKVHGESDLAAAKVYWNDIGTIVSKEDPWMNQGGNQRALSIHQKTTPLFAFFDSSWPVHAILQYGNRQSDHPFSDDWGNFSIVNNLVGHNMPVVNDEYGYIGECGGSPCNVTGQVYDQAAHRRAIWGIAVAGGYGSTGDFKKINNQAPIFSADWQDQPEYKDIQRLVAFFVNRVANWPSMSSQNSLVISGTRVYALALSGTRYVVYAAQGGSFTLSLPAPSGATTYKVYRIDPRNYDPATNPETFIGTVGGGSRSFTMPDNQDWALLIEI